MDNRKNNEDKVKKFIAESLKNKNSDIYKSDGKPSPGKLVKLLKAKTGITITRQTMATYLKDDLSAYAISVDFSQNEKIIEITAAMQIAKGLYESDTTKPGDKTRAMNSWRQLNQQLIDYEANLREIEIRKVEAGRPNYLIKIEPGCAEQTCPKCGHTFFIINDENKEEKKEKAYFESGNGQGTTDEKNKDKDEDNN